MVKIHSYEIYSKQLKDTLRRVKNFKSLFKQNRFHWGSSTLEVVRHAPLTAAKGKDLQRKG